MDRRREDYSREREASSMLKITDRFKLDTEDLKRELMYQTDEYRQQFDAVLAATDINQRMAGCRRTV